MKRLLILAGLLLLAPALPAAAAVGDYAVFVTTRDWSNLAGDDDFASSGQCAYHRAYKWDWQEGMVLDWDTQAMAEWIAAHPLEGQGSPYPDVWPWPFFYIERYECTLLLTSADGWTSGWPQGVDPTDVQIEVRTLNLGQSGGQYVDWAEGDGGCDPNPFGWTPETAAATNAYARTYWRIDIVDWEPVLDVGDCVGWVGFNDEPLEAFRDNRSALMRHLNSERLALDAAAIQAGEQVGVVLDYEPGHPAGLYPAPVLNDLLSNEDNRGLVLGYSYYWDEGSGWVRLDGCNGTFYTRDSDVEAYRPRIRIEIVRDPFCVCDGALYTIWADNYLRTGVPPWSEGGCEWGNLNEDDTVDGADYTVWADCYMPDPYLPYSWPDANADGAVDGSDYTLWADGFGCEVCGRSVPEPGALSLLAAGALLAIAVPTRRRWPRPGA